MGAIEVEHYLGRARDFLRGMALLKDQLDQYSFSLALLAIHGAISYCDALRIGLGSKRVSSEDHKSVTRELVSLLASRRCDDRQGVERLERLLVYKSLVAYSVHRVSEKDIRLIVQQAERFAQWAERIGRQLRVEGWEND